MAPHLPGADGSYGFKSVVTHDSDEHAAALDAWDQTYNQLSAGSFQGALQQIWLNRIHLFRERTNRAVAQSGLPCKDHFVFGVPLAMSDTAVPKSSGVYANEPRTAIPRPGRGTALPGAPIVFLPPKPALAEFRGWLSSLFAPDGLQPLRLVDPMFRRALCETVVGQLASLLFDAVRVPLRSPSFPGRCRVVEQAVAFALSCGAEPVSVGELCAKAKVSRRLLNYCFQDVLNTNPVHYLKAVRLNGVRRELRRAEPGPGVIRDIAGRWGFWHFSRFAREYRSLFGELPSETLSANRIHPT